MREKEDAELRTRAPEDPRPGRWNLPCGSRSYALATMPPGSPGTDREGPSAPSRPAPRASGQQPQRQLSGHTPILSWEPATCEIKGSMWLNLERSIVIFVVRKIKAQNERMYAQVCITPEATSRGVLGQKTATWGQENN